MKIINLFKSIAFIATLSLLSSCTDSDKSFKTEVKDIQTYTFTPTKTVAAINALATTTPVIYTSDDIIEAYVTSNDATGNFYKLITFQDVPTASGTPVGFSVVVDKSMTYADGFYPGRKVYIKLKGLYYAKVYGSLKFGINDVFDGIPSLEYQNYLFPSSTVLNEDELVRHMTLANALTDANQNTLVETDNVQFVNASLNRTFYDINSGGYATNHVIEDPNVGTTGICRISQYASFSVNNVPSGRGSIRGVMTKYNSDYQYMVRYENDFKLTGTRLTPLLNEDFSNGIGAWNAFSVVGTQVWAQAAYGNPAPCASMSGYSSGNKANEDWLISPALNLSSYTSATLTFDSAYSYTGAAIQVLVSSNYSGSGSPASATWTTLSPTLSSGSFAWASSGALNISSFAGNSAVYVAFKYTSTTSAASTWEIDNVKVIGN